MVMWSSDVALMEAPNLQVWSSQSAFWRGERTGEIFIYMMTCNLHPGQVVSGS